MLIKMKELLRSSDVQKSKIALKINRCYKYPTYIDSSHDAIKVNEKLCLSSFLEKSRNSVAVGSQKSHWLDRSKIIKVSGFLDLVI